MWWLVRDHSENQDFALTRSVCRVSGHPNIAFLVHFDTAHEIIARVNTAKGLFIQESSCSRLLGDIDIFACCNSAVTHCHNISQTVQAYPNIFNVSV